MHSHYHYCIIFSLYTRNFFSLFRHCSFALFFFSLSLPLSSSHSFLNALVFVVVIRLRSRSSFFLAFYTSHIIHAHTSVRRNTNVLVLLVSIFLVDWLSDIKRLERKKRNTKHSRDQNKRNRGKACYNIDSFINRQIFLFFLPNE